MLRLWNTLENKFLVVGSSNRTTRAVLLIAKLLFWLMYAEGHIDSAARQKSFTAFFGLEEEK